MAASTKKHVPALCLLFARVDINGDVYGFGRHPAMFEDSGARCRNPKTAGILFSSLSALATGRRLQLRDYGVVLHLKYLFTCNHLHLFGEEFKTIHRCSIIADDRGAQAGNLKGTYIFFGLFFAAVFPLCLDFAIKACRREAITTACLLRKLPPH